MGCGLGIHKSRREAPACHPNEYGYGTARVMNGGRSILRRKLAVGVVALAVLMELVGGSARRETWNSRADLRFFGGRTRPSKAVR